MCDLDKVIYLCPPFNNSVPYSSPVNGGVGPNLNIVFYYNPSNLWNFIMNPFVFYKTESITPYDRAAMYYNTTADFSLLPYGNIWIYYGVVSYKRIGANSFIGDNTIIYPNVTIREETKIGCRVIVHSGAVIGSDGFGFVKYKGVR